MPWSMSKTFRPFSRAKARQDCWLAAYFWSLPVGLQSKVKTVRAGSARPGRRP
jgi:hypothetical protein